MKFYVDGVLVGMESAPSCFDHSDDLWFGAYQGVTEEFQGEIDEVRLWDVERTQEEIASTMSLALEQAPGLLAVWHLDGDGSDAVGVNDGTLFGDAVFVPSTAPVGFSIDPPLGDWGGGQAVRLSGLYGTTDPQPTVLFGGIPSPAVSRVDSTTLRAIVPPGRRPGETVIVEVVESGARVSSVQPYLYTPHLTGDTDITVGAEGTLELLFDAPAQVVVARGEPVVAGTPYKSYGWLLELRRPVVVFSASAPTQTRLEIPVPVPTSPSVIGTTMIFQALVGPLLDGSSASFTNAHAVTITPGED